MATSTILNHVFMEICNVAIFSKGRNNFLKMQKSQFSRMYSNVLEIFKLYDVCKDSDSESFKSEK